MVHTTRPIALQLLQQKVPDSQGHWVWMIKGGSCWPAAEKQTNEYPGTAGAQSAPAHAALTLWMANELPQRNRVLLSGNGSSPPRRRNTEQE